MKVAIIFGQYPINAQKSWLKMGQTLDQEKDLTVRIFINNKNTRGEFTSLKEYSRVNRIVSILKNGYSEAESFFSPLISFNADIIHLIDAHVFPSIKNIINWEKTKLIATFRGFDTLVQPHTEPEWKAELMEIYRLAHNLHFVSNHLLEKAVELGASREKCMVIYQSVDSGVFKKTDRKAQDKSIKIISTGRLVWEKGYVYALEAIAQLYQTHHNIFYSIWGSGPDINLLNFHIRRLGLTSCCFLKGEASKTELYKNLTDSDIYLLPSLSEGVPNSILEASAIGLPIVSTLVGGIPEVVKHGITGLLSPPANSIELAINLEKLILDKQYGVLLGQAGARMINEFHTQAKELNDWRLLYNKTFA